MATWTKLTPEMHKEQAKRDLKIITLDHVPNLGECFDLVAETKKFFETYTKLGNKNQHEKTEYYCTSLASECYEMLENVRGWKPHQRNPPPVNLENVSEEIADMMHFLINLCLEWNIDSSRLKYIFLSKHIENRRRQYEGY